MARVLIVDDEIPYTKLYAKVAKGIGYDSKTAYSAEDGLDILLERPAHEWNCILLDQNMPGMSGLDFLKKMSGEYVRIPVISITGDYNALDKPAYESYALGGIHFLPKPFKIAELRPLLFQYK